MSLDFARRSCQLRAEQYDVRANYLVTGGKGEGELGLARR